MISQHVEGGVATVTVDDLTPLSRHDAAFALALRDVVVELADADTVKAIVLRTGATDFCPEVPDAGIVSGQEVWTSWNQAFAASDTLYQSLCFSKKVVITEVTGVCAGAGSMLVLCSDLTIASDDATFRSPLLTIPEANVVLAALTMRLNRAKAWLLQDATLSAAQADRAGLVNRVVPRPGVAAAVGAMARSVTRMPLDGVTMSKMLLQSVLDAQGVGREFDMAGFYAAALASTTRPVPSSPAGGG